MSYRTGRVAALAVVVFNASIAGAADLLVPQQYGTIQSALDAAAPGDTVLVSPGTYFENLLIIKAVSLRSTRGARETVIDGRQVAQVIVARGSGAESVAISGFTITNGFHGESFDAGGLHFESVSALVADSVVRGNVGCVGSGMSSLTSAMTIQRNRVADNTQDPACDGADGGGIMMRGDGAGASLVANNLVSNNRTGGRGAGIAAQGMNQLTIRENLVSGNEANSPGGGSGGGILINIGSAIVTGNVLHGNSAQSGGGVALFPVDNADRVVFSGNVLGQNQASSSGSAVYLVTVSDQSLQMTSNVVDGNTEASLVQCDGGPFVVPASNRLRNARGPELGGACEPEAAR